MADQATGFVPGNVGTSIDPQEFAPGPPGSEEELAERKSAWSSFIQQLQTDPSMQQAMFTVGAQMLQPRSQTQSQAGHLGQALLQGQQVMLQSRSNRNRGAVAAREQQRLDVEQNRKGAETGENIATSKENRRIAGVKLQPEVDLLKAQASKASATAAGKAASDVQMTNLLANSFIKQKKANTLAEAQEKAVAFLKDMGPAEAEVKLRSEILGIIDLLSEEDRASVDETIANFVGKLRVEQGRDVEREPVVHEAAHPAPNGLEPTALLDAYLQSNPQARPGTEDYKTIVKRVQFFYPTWSP